MKLLFINWNAIRRFAARTNSLDAMELFRSDPDAFDLVITDYTMRHMTGVDLAKEMLQIRPDIPIVLCTGCSEMISEVAAKEMGIRAFVMKPLGRQNIARVIRKVLNKETP
ncbi:MAG: response regulator [Syntrophobacteraceae bacterium]